jgi:hypothetical protein
MRQRAYNFAQVVVGVHQCRLDELRPWVRSNCERGTSQGKCRRVGSGNRPRDRRAKGCPRRKEGADIQGATTTGDPIAKRTREVCAEEEGLRRWGCDDRHER